MKSIIKSLLILLSIFALCLKSSAQVSEVEQIAGANQILNVWYDTTQKYVFITEKSWDCAVAISENDYDEFHSFLDSVSLKFYDWKKLAEETMDESFIKKINSVFLSKSYMIVEYDGSVIPENITVSTYFKFTYNKSVGSKDDIGQESHKSELIIQIDHHNDIYSVYKAQKFTTGYYYGKMKELTNVSKQAGKYDYQYVVVDYGDNDAVAKLVNKTNLSNLKSKINDKEDKLKNFF